MAVIVIGVDGRPLPAWAADRLTHATLVLGSARHFDAVPVPEHASRHLLGDLVAGVDAIRAHDGNVAVLAAGDPGFFGIVRILREGGIDLEIAPAVSSVAAAFALVATNWDDALVVSAHGRELRYAVNVCRAAPKVAVLTGPTTGPAQLGAALAGLPRRFVVAENLGGANQRLVECTPEQAATQQWADPNLVLVLADVAASNAGWSWPRRQTPSRWALADDAFEHRDGMVTKSEVRALALAHLGPGLGDLAWDIGAGSGAVAVECARFGAAAIAVDRDAEQCERARNNAIRHGIELTTVHGHAPGCLSGLPDPDVVFIGGGGPHVVRATAGRQPRTIVAVLTAVDRVGPTRDALRDSGFTVHGASLAANRFTDLPDSTTRLAATNPVFLLWGDR